MCSVFTFVQYIDNGSCKRIPISIIFRRDFYRTAIRVDTNFVPTTDADFQQEQKQ